LAEIDSYAEANGLSRSGFLTRAAKRQLEAVETEQAALAAA
jgi:hypothetical protein